MRLYHFEFTKKGKKEWVEHKFYEEDDVKAWKKADEWAFLNGYADYRLKEII